MNEFKADLHCHSTCSDGTLTPEEIVALAKERGLNALSITDHDSFAAYPRVFEIAKSYEIEMITGAEFSTEIKEKSVHILAYNFDVNSKALLQICKRHKERRHERNLKILQNLKKEGFPITEEELLSFKAASIGRPHIAHIMVKKGFVPDIKAAFNRYLGDGKSCFARGEPLTIEETLFAIHQAKGIAVLAHPHLYQSKKFVRQIIEEQIKNGFDGTRFDGIECYYANMTMSDNTPWLALAEEYGLIPAGGSDFHGGTRPGIQLGASWVNEELFRRLAS